MHPVVQQIIQRKYPHFFLIAGPCVVEDRQMCVDIALQLKAICEHLNIPFIFKASYRKANRTKIDSFTGIGDEPALETLQYVREKLDIPVLTDIHSVEEVSRVAKYADVLQIPALLCRQTDLLIAAGKTGLPVNIKKGQFASADTMRFAVEKVGATGNPNAWLTERGNSFGYHDLVVDFRNIPAMQQFGVPVIFDATHSVQQPNQPAGGSGGNAAQVAVLARAGIAAGADGLFIETHPDPLKAPSDGSNMLPLEEMKDLLEGLVKIAAAIVL